MMVFKNVVRYEALALCYSTRRVAPQKLVEKNRQDRTRGHGRKR